MDRAEFNRALAQALAYHACGKVKEAKAAADRLIYMLRAIGLAS